MILKIITVVALVFALLAIVTALGTLAIERRHPPSGRFVDVDGGRMHVRVLGETRDGPPIVLLHGASGNLLDMMLGFGERVSAKHKVILIDRPGHGWSDRPGGIDDASPARQAALIAQALDKLGIRDVIMTGHSLAGAVATAFAISYPQRTVGLVLLAPVSHPWVGPVAWFYRLATAPVVGQIFARTVVMPLSFPLMDKFAAPVFWPQPLPKDYIAKSAAALVLRPSEFIANAQDVVQLRENIIRQVPRYAEIVTPTVIITGDRDVTVSPDIHAKTLVKLLPNAVLHIVPGAGHAIQHEAQELVAREIDRLAALVDNAGRAR